LLNIQQKLLNFLQTLLIIQPILPLKNAQFALNLPKQG